jgi:hypothetical protein
MSHCVWYAGQRGSWSQTIVEWLCRGFHHHSRVDTVPKDANAVVCVKADSMLGDKEKINVLMHELKRLPGGVVIVVSNEEGEFPTSLLFEKCPHMKIWLQSRGPFQFAHHYIPWGWTPASPRFGMKRRLDWSFLGQVTHQRRHECVDVFRNIPRGLLVETDGFAKGIRHDIYHETLSVTKFVPCPSGPITVDSFRVCEALQMGAIPLLDGGSPRGWDIGYWALVFDQCPLPIITDWKDAPAIMESWLGDWAIRQGRIARWWEWQKLCWKKMLEIHMKEYPLG